MIRHAVVLAVSTVISLVMAGCLCYGFSAITGTGIFIQCFWEVAQFALVGLGILAGFAGLVLGSVWLLLSDRSPIPAVRARWTRRLTPDRAAAQTPIAADRCAPTSKEGATS